ncbi:hypothetical protein K6U06_07060 [Acidiferrimicrobium sp. IK]|uniref:hypothetical protein n=1 Tax=Acidiferrimicrobium sp. IK TaxID=2871700 RepID=UPI0021CB78D8|nr:hypothetical protein [Acidiferrimicrobium sp. IK]MCU4184113.1 hypothetical protein [Acidiferrimicrobium sp. IK]
MTTLGAAAERAHGRVGQLLRYARLGRLLRVAVVLAANVTSFGMLWVAQFLLCDRVLFREPAVERPGAEAAETARCSQ